MWIAPSRHPEISNWTDAHWKALTFSSEHDWDTAIKIFEDRIIYRYLDAIDVLQKDDNAYYLEHDQRRLGFSMMALDCLLIETLAQFYDGLKDSDEAKKALRLNSTDFYVKFLTEKSFKLKSVFDEPAALAFYRTIRCGILHQAETKKDSTIRFFDDKDYSDTPFALSADGESLRIHWVDFHRMVKNEFETYCAHLRTNDVPGLREKFRQKMDFICRMGNGILAFGSLLSQAGNELREITDRIESNIQTPFQVEYARRSKSRADAPTLVIVPAGLGSQVNGAIFVLKEDADTKTAKDILFRRELHMKADKNEPYDDAAQRAKKDALVIETLVHFHEFGEIHYTGFKPNFTEILDASLGQEEKAELLALAAIDSLTKETFYKGLDGIRYLHDNIQAGVITPLTEPYNQALLQWANNVPDLPTARLYFARQKGLIP
jgi:hypothetical protein